VSLRLPEWLRDRAVRKIAKFGVPVAIGQVATAASGVITLAILARALGPGPLGVIALLRTVVTVVDSFANFNTWLAIIKYGTEAIADGRKHDLRRVIKLAFVIDASTATLGALVVSVLAFTIGGGFGWTSHESMLCALYSLTLVSKTAGTSDGIYRICDAYRVQAIATSLMAVVMTSLVGLAYALDAGFDGIVLALIGGEVLSNLVVTGSAWWVARESGYGGWLTSSLHGVRTRFPGIVRFMVSTNAQLTVRTAQAEVDMIVVGSMLGKTAAGLFRVVKQLSRIPLRIVAPFEQVLFTELARHAAARDYAGFGRLLRRFVILAGAGAFLVWLVTAAIARPIIELVAGGDFVDAADAFRWYLFAMVLQVMGAPIMRAMIALGRPGTLFIFDAVSLGIWLGLCVAGASLYGLVGLCAAAVLHRLLQMGWLGLAVWRIVRNATSAEPIAPPAS
jgi:O-antigen/teichoic acid export membrane protein